MIMKVGILTYHRAINYGAYLQSCALVNRLNMEEGISAEIIDFHMKKEVNQYAYNWSLNAKLRHYGKYLFLSKRKDAIKTALDDPLMVKSGDYCLSDTIEAFKDFVKGKYDLIIVGSDEIWNFNSFRGFPTPYWLIGDLGCRKMSYAASCRQDFSSLSTEHQALITRTLEEYEFIGVRDPQTKEGIENLSKSLKPVICSDPTFLFDFQVSREFFDKRLQREKKYNPNLKTIVAMSDDLKLNRYLYNELHHDYNLISIGSYTPKFINLPDLKPLEWIDVIARADLVITTYFHGTCFSIIEKRPFLAFGTEEKSSKVGSLLSLSGLNDNYVPESQKFINENRIHEVLDYYSDDENYQILANKSEAYIKLSRERFSSQFLKAIKVHTI